MTSAAPAMAEAPLKPIPAAAAAYSPRVRLFLDIITRAPEADIESALSRAAAAFPAPLTASDVESVLKLSYSHPTAAVKFFRWSGHSIKHSFYTWNLIVDILGKNLLFEPMWDAIRSMKHESVLSTATFASAFSAYCSAGKIKEAIMTFDVMERYGAAPDPIALNSLLSFVCGVSGHTSEAAAFFDKVKARVQPDADTFAILLEGWEKEGNVQRAKTTFGEMVVRVGWNPSNMSAYDAFLTTLVRAGQPAEAINFLRVMKSKNCHPGIKFFSTALDILVKNNDARHAVALWDLMVTDSGLVPDTVMYNAIIALSCNNLDFDSAYRFLDAMPFHGAFPDPITYNTIFECLMRGRRANDAGKFFAEMRRNEQRPSPSNCLAAIKLFLEEFDLTTALEVWSYASGEQARPDEDCANELLVGLSGLGRLGELKKYTDEVLDMGVRLRPDTMDKLQVAFSKGRLDGTYELIERRARDVLMMPTNALR